MGAATDTLPGILAIFNNVACGREAEFEEWFQHEHLAERIAVPGFLIGRMGAATDTCPAFLRVWPCSSTNPSEIWSACAAAIARSRCACWWRYSACRRLT